MPEVPPVVAGHLVETSFHNGTFWYSRWSALGIVFVLFVIAQTVSPLIPPFQSDNESEHLKRAYLFSKGELFLGTRDGMTGGDIDTGLVEYMESFEYIRFNYDSKVTLATLRSTHDVHWSGRREFRGLPNTAFYCPLPYVPQALAFIIGEHSGMTIRESYYLARLLSLLTTVTLLYAALVTFEMPLMVLGILALPMALFQLASASLDSVTFGLASLTGALFMRGADRNASFTATMHTALAICVLMLATSRINLFPLTSLTCVLFFYRKSKSYLASGAIVIALSLAWVLYTLMSVRGVPPRGVSTQEIIQYYVTGPGSFIKLLFATLTNTETLKGYWSMFVGVLGWLDVALGSEVYIGFAVLLSALALVCIGSRRRAVVQSGGPPFAFLVVSCTVLMFFLFLVTYNSHPASSIDGIEGRYFITLMILIAYAIFGSPFRLPELRIGLVLLALMSVLSIIGMVPRLLARYWLT